jgi:hypothetical protein
VKKGSNSCIMRRRIFITLVLLVAAGARTIAQETPRPPRPATPAPRVAPWPEQKNKPEKPPKAKVDNGPEIDGPEQDKPIEPVTMKLVRGSKVGVTSKAVNVIVTGVDGDTLTATARSEVGAQPVQADVTGDPASPKVLLYVPAARVRRVSREVTLEVKVPRYVELETIESNRGNIQVTGMDAPVVVTGGNGNIEVLRVGPLKVGSRGGTVSVKEVKGNVVLRSYNGNVSVDTVSGKVDVESANGSVTVSKSEGDVRAISAIGDLDLHCVKGRAVVSTASGSITLNGVVGDVDAQAVGGDVSFKGMIRGDGTYRLKTISGSVEMAIQPDAPGFSASLLTYSGEIETAFPLKVDTPINSPINRAMKGTYKGGGAQILLDSFSGSATLRKAPANSLKECH